MTPTTLTELRSFLEDQDVVLAPWSHPEAAVAALRGLLRARRADPAFWAELEALAARMADRRARPLLDQLEVLDDAQTAGLFGALRAELERDTAPGQWRTPRSVGGFALLLLALGCGGKKDDTAGKDTADTSDTADTADTSDTADESCEEATTYHVPVPKVDTYCAIVEFVKASGVTRTIKDTLLSCIVETQNQMDDLLAALQSADETQIDQVLEDYYYANWECFCDDPPGCH